MNAVKISTTLYFETTNDQTTIDEAMLAAFPHSEWCEVRSRSTFESPSLCDAIIDRYFVNADQVRANVSNHRFDVRCDFAVSLSFDSAVQPILRSLCLSAPLTADTPLSVPNFEQSIATEITTTC